GLQLLLAHAHRDAPSVPPVASCGPGFLHRLLEPHPRVEVGRLPLAGRPAVRPLPPATRLVPGEFLVRVGALPVAAAPAAPDQLSGADPLPLHDGEGLEVVEVGPRGRHAARIIEVQPAVIPLTTGPPVP